MLRLLARSALLLGLVVSLSPPSMAQTPRKLVIAVLYFDNNSPNKQYDVLQKGLADMMVTDLSGIDGVQVVEREKLQKLIEELKLEKTSFFDPSTAQKLGRGIGANYAVTGAITSVAPRIRLDMRLIEIATGRIVLASKIVGPRDHFFELQDQLVAQFKAGLHLGDSGGVATSNRIQNVSMLLAYSKGVDSADRGDLQAAAAQLAKVLQQSPGFQLARLRREEILRRLQASGQRRQAILSSLSDELMQHADEYLREHDIAELSIRDAGTYFGYRALRSNFILWGIQKQLMKNAYIRALYGESTVLPENREGVTELMRAFDENMKTLITELKTYSQAQGAASLQRLSYRMAPEDQSRARKLGVIQWVMPRSIADADVMLASFLMLGSVPRARMPLRPSLAHIDPASAHEAQALIDEALADIDARKGRQQEREYVDAQEVAGEGLIALDHEEEGIAHWQAVLDKYPTSSEYARIEKKITDQVDADKADAEDATAIASAPCDMGLVSVLAPAFQRLMKKRGLAGAEDAVARIEARCGSSPGDATYQSIYVTLAGMANMVGDCGELRTLRAKSARMGTSFLAMYDNLLRQCR